MYSIESAPHPAIPQALRLDAGACLTAQERAQADETPEGCVAVCISAEDKCHCADALGFTFHSSLPNKWTFLCSYTLARTSHQTLNDPVPS